MFCNHCGKRIKPGAVKCSCGAPVEQMEACGGFWGLVGKSPKASSTSMEPMPMSRNEIAERGYKPAAEKAEFNGTRGSSEGLDHISDRQESRNRSSKTGIGLFAGIVVAVLALVGGGAFFLFGGHSGSHTPRSGGKVAEEASTERLVAETTENPEAQSQLSLEQLIYAKDHYVIPMFEKLEKQEKRIWNDYYKKADVTDPDEENQTLREAWNDFEKEAREVRKDYDRLRGDFESIKKGDSADEADFESFILQQEKALVKAELDIAVHDTFSSIGKEGDAYVSKAGTDVLNESGWLSDAYVEDAEKILDTYQNLQASYVNREAKFASWVYLTRLEVVLSDNYIASCQEILQGASERESLDEMDAQDYQQASRVDGDFEKKMKRIQFCLDDLGDSPAKSHIRMAEEYKKMSKLPEKTDATDKQEEPDTKEGEDSSAATSSSEEDPSANSSSPGEDARQRRQDDPGQGKRK